MSSTGSIIAVVGAPRSGKSFLVKKLAEELGGVALLEGEEGEFPPRIEEDIRENIRPLERVLWFRNTLVARYLRALELKKEGRAVVLDVFWLSPQLFIDALLDGFEREVMQEVAEQDKRMLGWPDLIIFLQVNERSIRTFLELGGRSFDRSESFVTEVALPVNQKHEEFFAQEQSGIHVLKLQRDELDFENQEHVQKVSLQCKAYLLG